MTRDPADVGHAPVNIGRMDVLHVFGGAGGVGQISARSVLAALGFSGGAAGVHQEQRVFGIHLFGFDPSAVVVFEHIVDKIIPSIDHRCRAGGLAGIALPYEDLVYLLSVLARQIDGNVRILLVVEQRPAAVIRIRRDQHPAAGVDDPVGAGTTAETTEHLAVNDPEAGTCQHGNRQFRYHRHVEGHPVAALRPAKSLRRAANSFTRTYNS